MKHSVQPDKGIPAGQLALAAGLTIVAAYAGYRFVQANSVNQVANRPQDDAPQRSARRAFPGKMVQIGRTITVNRPRSEVFAFWSDLSNLSEFMENVKSVSVDGDLATWQLSGPLRQTIDMKTTVTERHHDERLAWASTGDSAVTASGRVTFRDAPADRGTEIEAEISYKPPMGEIGRWMGKIFQTDPLIQGRRELRRFKMLMEAGEIATNRNHSAA